MKENKSWIDELPISISEEGKRWAYSQMESMTLSQKIGQLIHIATWSNKSQVHIDDISHLINEYGIGGIIFFQGDPEKQAQHTNYYQGISKVPLMVSIDAEWGLGMRLDGIESFPYQLTLGAIKDEKVVYEMGKAIGKQLKRVGVNVNFAPVIDINTNPANPVINFRSFGEDKRNVASRGISYMKGLQGEGILACAKHFPGHGDTDADSHKELPLLDKSIQELIETELYPFEQLIDSGIGSIMTAHLHIPQLDPFDSRASTMSPEIIDGLLKKKMNFKGLVFTDALDMKAISDHYQPGFVDVEALKAGNDVLVFVNYVSVAIKEINKAISNGEISEEQIEKRCLKQLLYKYWMGLSEFKPIDSSNIAFDINSYVSQLNQKLYESSITSLNGRFEKIKKDESVTIISLFADGDKTEVHNLAHHTLLKGKHQGEKNSFESQLMEYFDSKPEIISVKYDDNQELQSKIISNLKEQSVLIIAVHDVKLKAVENFGITENLSQFLTELLIYKKCQIVFFGNPYALGNTQYLEKAESVIITYQENDYTTNAAFKVITGQLEAKGTLPVSINTNYIAGKTYQKIE